ncbi:hypothetical protein [Paenibacillus pseudetheri]|nr:hypothetical protein [Paenibacillus pseudetheri]
MPSLHEYVEVHVNVSGRVDIVATALVAFTIIIFPKKKSSLSICVSMEIQKVRLIDNFLIGRRLMYIFNTYAKNLIFSKLLYGMN